MLYVGIVIFTIYTKMTVFVGDCVGGVQDGLCADIGRTVQTEQGRYVPQYAGIYKSYDECREKTQSISYRDLKKDERVGDMTEIICVPQVTQ